MSRRRVWAGNEVEIFRSPSGMVVEVIARRAVGVLEPGEENEIGAKLLWCAWLLRLCISEEGVHASG